MTGLVGRRRWAVGLFALLVVAGVVFRVWIVRSRLGLVDGDEAVVGLMARRMLHGHAEAFFWGQEYGGTQEPMLVALLLALRVPGRWAMELVPAGLAALGSVLVWRIGLRSFWARRATVSVAERAQNGEGEGEGAAAAALLAAGLAWAASPGLVWFSTKERGFYGVTTVLGLAVVLLALRLAERVSVRDAVLVGLAAGCGWWASPQILHFAVPAALWLAWTRRADLRSLLRIATVAAPAAVAGALPWLWANAHTHLGSLAAAGAERRSFGSPVSVFLRYLLPMALGLRAPYTLAWEVPAARVVYVLVLAGLVLAIVLRRPRAAGPVLLALALYLPIFALLPTTYYYGDPRYLTFLLPLLALLAGAGVAWLRPGLQVVAVVAVLAVTGNGILHMTRLEGPPGKPLEDMAPHPVGPVAKALTGLGVDRAFADYWIAYRLAWETHERIRATPIQLVRSPVDDAVVRKAPVSAYVAVAGSCLDDRIRAGLAAHGIAFTSVRADLWDVVVPARRARPEDVVPEPC